MSLDNKLEGWDAGLLALISQIEAWKVGKPPMPKDVVLGWDDAISAARKLIRDARTQKGLLRFAPSVRDGDGGEEAGRG